jgi:hypothetical protein
MSLRNKSVPKPRPLLHSPPKTYTSLRDSIRKVQSTQYEAKLNSLRNELPIASPPSSSNSRRNKAFFQTMKYPGSPSRYLKTDTALQWSSSESLDLLSKSSYCENYESGLERTLESPLLLSIQKKFPDSIEYETELELKKKENNQLKNKLEELQGRTMNASRKKEVVYGFSRELKRELKIQKEILEEKFRGALEKERKKAKKERERMKKEIGDKIMEKQRAAKANFQQEIRQGLKYELDKKDEENEIKIKIAVEEVSLEYERQMNSLKEEISWLRRQNEGLRNKIEANNSKVEESQKIHFYNTEIISDLIDESMDHGEMVKEFKQLQLDYMALKKKSANPLCSKCKAFANTNTELAGKIERIRAYLGK